MFGYDSLRAVGLTTVSHVAASITLTSDVVCGLLFPLEFGWTAVASSFAYCRSFRTDFVTMLSPVPLQHCPSTFAAHCYEATLCIQRVSRVAWLLLPLTHFLDMLIYRFLNSSVRTAIHTIWTSSFECIELSQDKARFPYVPLCCAYFGGCGWTCWHSRLTDVVEAG